MIEWSFKPFAALSAVDLYDILTARSDVFVLEQQCNYRDIDGLDEQGCAVAPTANGSTLNPACPIVHQHVCAASAESVQVNVQLGRRDQAERLKQTPVTQLRCPPEPFERLLPARR